MNKARAWTRRCASLDSRTTTPSALATPRTTTPFYRSAVLGRGRQCATRGQETADLVMGGARGEGVVELIDDLLRTDLRDAVNQLPGTAGRSGLPQMARPCSSTPSAAACWLLAAQAAGSRPSSPASWNNWWRWVRDLVVDPEGDYAELEEAVVLGDVDRPPPVPEALEVLERLDDGLVLNLLGVEVTHRPAFLARLLPELSRLRGRTGRPHWIVIDEAHHMLPAAEDAVAAVLLRELRATILVTVHPDQVASDALALVRTILAVGAEPIGTVRSYCAAVREAAPLLPDDVELQPGEALFWERGGKDPPRRVRFTGPRQERRRHTRKYAEGELGPDRQLRFSRAGECLEPTRAQPLDLRPDGRGCR